MVEEHFGLGSGLAFDASGGQQANAADLSGRGGPTNS